MCDAARMDSGGGDLLNSRGIAIRIADQLIGMLSLKAPLIATCSCCSCLQTAHC